MVPFFIAEKGDREPSPVSFFSFFGGFDLCLLSPLRAPGIHCMMFPSTKKTETELSDMNLRRLGKTNLMVSEVGFGGEWLERHPEEHSIELIRHAHAQGINLIDCWMPDPKSRNIIGKAIADCREEWYVQGHIGSTWQDGQYVRTRDMQHVIPAFEDLVQRIVGIRDFLSRLNVAEIDDAELVPVVEELVECFSDVIGAVGAAVVIDGTTFFFDTDERQLEAFQFGEILLIAKDGEGFPEGFLSRAAVGDEALLRHRLQKNGYIHR